MRLMTIVQEASRTGDTCRLNRRSATQVLRAIAEWLDDQTDGLGSEAARAIRDEIILGGGR